MQVNPQEVSGAKASTAGPVEIIVRFAAGTYVARAIGRKCSASNTIGARQAAEALCAKLRLDAAMLQEQPALLGKQQSLFVHPGVVV